MLVAPRRLTVPAVFVLAGDVLSAVLVFVGLNLLNLPTTGFALVNLVLCGLWLVVALNIGREYAKLTQDA